MSNPIVTIEMEDGGIIRAELYPEIAPNTVRNFISLVKKGFYDGVIFHRVIPGFMIQGGDPTGTGMGGPGYSIEGEFTSNGFKNDLKHTRGVLSMARAMDPNSAGSQFFIMHMDAPHLDKQYAAFGKVTEGMDVVDAIARTPRSMFNDKPTHEQKMKTVTVETFGVEYAGAGDLLREQTHRQFRLMIQNAFLPAPRLAVQAADAPDIMGMYRFRRGCGGRNSGRRRLTAIKRASYKLKNNNETVLLAA